MIHTHSEFARRRVTLRLLIVCLLLSGFCQVLPAFPLDWDFQLFPSPAIAGPPGSTIGWGYTLTNLDETSWILPSSLDAGVFQFAAPLSLFDFPVLAPLQSVTRVYDAGSFQGLYQLTWDPSAPLGFINTGVFTLTVDFYDGDPFDGGQLLFPGLTLDREYTATVADVGPEVPEPASALLLAIAFMALAALAQSNRCRWWRRSAFSRD